jgi:beta-ketodecanoyl-[acyl-carrier-protein] synthase
MTHIAISGTGLYIPPNSISNNELVNSYNQYAETFNHENAEAIAAGQVQPIPLSSSEFIEKASGIRSRYAMHKEGMLDIRRMKPAFAATTEYSEPETVTMGLAAAREALTQANIKPEDIDLLIVGTTNHQRPYPSIAVEIQHKLGCGGYAYDMGIACSSATFALIAAYNALKAGTARNALVVNPEFCTPQVNLKSRDSHFIFGDVATAAVLQTEDLVTARNSFRIINTRQQTRYSTNIHCLGNYSDNCQSNQAEDRPLFHQEGRKVFKELLPMVTEFIETQLSSNQLDATDLKRYWLHQANINMNLFAIKKLLGDKATPGQAPIVLDEFANTASAGSMIAFHRFRQDFLSGDKGLICSFGAGYSIGSLLVECH